MSSTDVGSAGSAEAPELSSVDMNLEVVTLPVSDVDRAKDFYASLGWRFDIDLVVSDDLRTVQFTPPHSQCSIQFGKGRTTAEPGSGQAMILVVDDIDAAREDLDQPRRRRQRGARGSAARLRSPRALLLREGYVQRPGRKRLGAPGDHHPAPRPDVGGLTWTSPLSRTFCTRPPGGTGRSRPSRHRTTGGTGTRPTWTPARAAAPRTTPRRAADRYMAEVKEVVV